MAMRLECFLLRQGVPDYLPEVPAQVSRCLTLGGGRTYLSFGRRHPVLNSWRQWRRQVAGAKGQGQEPEGQAAGGWGSTCRTPPIQGDTFRQTQPPLQ